MQHMMVSTLTLLLITASLAVAQSGDDNLYQVDIPVESFTAANSTCICKVMTGWSEMEEYLKLQDMRTRLDQAEEVIESMNFTAIFEQLQNVTDRLNSLEDVINSQAIATSVSELFALRKNVEVVVRLLEYSNSSNVVHEERARLEKELDDISEMTNDIWQRNPYKLKEDYKQEVSELRDRFSRCHKKADLSPFVGDSLPLNVSQSDGWCSKVAPIKMGFPLTHRWEENTRNDRGMWFKDPEPVNDTSLTEMWEMVYVEKTLYGRYNRKETQPQFKRFPKYTSLISNSQSETVANPEITGNGAMVYRNSLYYSYRSSLVKMDLDSNVKVTVAFRSKDIGYKIPSSSTYVDLKVDEMGLWVIYSMSSDKKITISKLDPDTLLIQKTWITDVLKTDVCAAFMICGRLYTVHSCGTTLPTTPNYVYDTHTSSWSYSAYHVPSVYGSLTQLTYNPRERLLFGWDKAHMVTYTVSWGEEE